MDKGESTVGITPRQRERKEKLRLQTAQVHAALSVTQLAAAVAGSAAMGGFGTHHSNNSISNMASQGDAWNEKMNMVIASAAALVAAACAEVAESAGARRANVASAVDSGLAAQTCIDMLALTANAATCKLQLSMVRIYHKHKKLILKLSKKHWLGVFTTHKEYGIIEVMKGIDEALFNINHQGLKLLKLTTCGGMLELMFQDEELCNIWMSTIAHFLSNHENLNH